MSSLTVVVLCFLQEAGEPRRRTTTVKLGIQTLELPPKPKPLNPEPKRKTRNASTGGGRRETQHNSRHALNQTNPKPKTRNLKPETQTLKL
jgi:hypothetical protein